MDSNILEQRHIDSCLPICRTLGLQSLEFYVEKKELYICKHIILHIQYPLNAYYIIVKYQGIERVNKFLKRILCALCCHCITSLT